MKRLTVLMGVCAAVSLMAATDRATAHDKEKKPGARAEQKKTDASAEHQIHKADELTWEKGPEGLPAGAEIAVLEGDPGEKGPFTIRLRFPAGYRIAPHTHPADERITILEGSMKLGSGKTFSDSELRELTAGSYVVMAKGDPHFGLSRDGVTLQIHAVGPWDIQYINPKDDPRKGRAEPET